MEHSSFDPQKKSQMAVTFDLPNGQVRLGAPDDSRAPGEVDTARSVIVPADALAAIATAAGDAAASELGRAIGRTLGARVRARLGDAVRDGSVEAVLTELAAELALVGLGTLAIERWGRALVIRQSGAPFEGSGPCDALLVSAIEAMVCAASGREVRALRLASDGEGSGRVLRVLLASAGAIDRVSAWLAEGVTWGDAITRLHAPKVSDADGEARA